MKSRYRIITLTADNTTAGLLEPKLAWILSMVLIKLIILRIKTHDYASLVVCGRYVAKASRIYILHH